ncbi:TonB-dependent siderophore receptor [Pseudokordiimonas caeni]|uniref:TonB-dependent siderophore receptor n=1 Tax=Pseudokordiimonas caeni TaxID=2997908 RepID=UPI0028124D6E|nr:TonB-dependent siderophore receptor [Pseudokordiimonas caeni]
MSSLTPHHSRHALMLSLMASAALITVPAAAQDAAGTDDAGIEEIIVEGSYTTNELLDSATGLGLSPQDTPQSVSVMTYQRIADQNLDSLTDIVMNAVGVSAKELDSTRFSFSARGFAIQNYQLDGVPLAWSPGGDSGETQIDTALYERIEIVRGATGLLTGAGDPSASINLVRKSASAREFTGFVSVDAASWDTYGILGDVATPLNEAGSIRARVVARYQDGDSFRDWGSDKKTVLYGTIEADLADNLLLRAGASYQDNDPLGSTWGGLPTWYADGSRTNWDRKKSIAPDWSFWASERTNYFATLDYDFAPDWSLKLNFNRNETSADLKLLYLFGVPDRETGVGLGASPYRADTESNQDSIDFQLQGAFSLFGRKHDLVLGGLHSKQATEGYTYAASNVSAIGNFNEWDGSYAEPTWGSEGSLSGDYDTKQTGFYAASRLNVSDAFKIVLGGRVSKWKQEGVLYGSTLDYGDSGVFIPYAGALYDLTENHTLYASYTEIFEPQNAQDRNGDFLPPLEGKNYEIGLKSTFFDDALHTTATLFLVQQDNLAQPDPGHLIPGTIFEASRAAKGTESKGFEFEAVGELAEGWNVSLGYTQFKAEDADGVAVNTSQPRKLLKVFSTYTFPGDWDKLTIGGGVNWEGRNYTDTTNPVTGNAERLVQKSYILANLMARYDISEALSLQANVENLFDKTYYSQIGFYSQLAYGEPRRFTVRARYSF